jgi:hypothetical protein
MGGGIFPDIGFMPLLGFLNLYYHHELFGIKTVSRFVVHRYWHRRGFAVQAPLLIVAIV